MRCICAACASAIFPQPIIAALTMVQLLFATFEIAAEAIRNCHSWFPAELLPGLCVCKSRLLPIAVPRGSIERCGQLLFRPGGVFLPDPAQEVTCEVRDV